MSDHTKYITNLKPLLSGDVNVVISSGQPRWQTLSQGDFNRIQRRLLNLWRRHGSLEGGLESRTL